MRAAIQKHGSEAAGEAEHRDAATIYGTHVTLCLLPLATSIHAHLWAWRHRRRHRRHRAARRAYRTVAAQSKTPSTGTSYPLVRMTQQSLCKNMTKVSLSSIMFQRDILGPSCFSAKVFNGMRCAGPHRPLPPPGFGTLSTRPPVDQPIVLN